jgi:hypothetical protein
MTLVVLQILSPRFTNFDSTFYKFLTPHFPNFDSAFYNFLTTRFTNPLHSTPRFTKLAAVEESKIQAETNREIDNKLVEADN